MEPLDYDTVEALQAAQRGLRTEATLYLGRPSHAYTESKRFRENVAALVAYLEYDAKRRKRALSNGGTGAPQWSDDRWKKHRLQMTRLDRILAHFQVKLAEDVANGVLTIDGIRRYMQTGSLEEEEAPRKKPATRPPRNKAAERKSEQTAA